VAVCDDVPIMPCCPSPWRRQTKLVHFWAPFVDNGAGVPDPHLRGTGCDRPLRPEARWLV